MLDKVKFNTTRTFPKFYSNYAISYDEYRMILLVGDVSQNYVNELISRTRAQYGTIISKVENERRARVINQGVPFTIDVLDLPGLAKSVTEVIANKNLITGEKLTEKEQWVNLGVSSVPFIPTALLKTANITSKTIDGAKALECIDMATDISKVSNVLSDSSKLILSTSEEFGKLTYVGDKFTVYNSTSGVAKKWISSKGIVYELDADYGNRVLHVLAHLEPDSSKRIQTIFNVPRDKVLALVDEAWTIRKAPLHNDSQAYVIDMGRVIGTNGETKIKIVVSKDTSIVKTAYPIR